jgi:hypothetical protein
MKNPPAFPRSMISSNGPFDSSTYSNGYGMDLRDYFAASFVESGHVFKIISDGNTPELVAEQAYALADAMLKVREA